MAIKAIIFDCFGVLVTSARVALKNDYPKFKSQIDDLDHQTDYGLISRQQFNAALSGLIGLSVNQIESRYWGSSVKVESAINWLRELKKTGKYKIGILSNVGHGFFNSYFDLAEQKELFDEVVLSSDVDMAKPEFEIFELTAMRLGVKPSECVMVDDIYLNIDAAKNAGMQGIWFISIDQAIDDLNKILESENA